MDCPPGLIHQDQEVLLLLKALYGLVQAASLFILKFIKILKEIGFDQSIVEPCLLIKKSSLGIVIMVIHVDNCFTIGNKAAMQETIKQITEKGLKLKVEERVTDYLGCEPLQQIMFIKHQELLVLIL